MNKNVKLTIATATYNRAHLLPRLYRSLLNQSRKDFIWLVVDDGSTDGTKDLIEKWIADGTINIRYYKKENGGLHTALNMALDVIDTELFMRLDSDDKLFPKAVENILDIWKDGEDYTGIVGYKYSFDGNQVIGKSFPNEKYLSWKNLVFAYGCNSDRAIILRTEDYKSFRYPEYPGEAIYPDGEMYLWTDNLFILTDRRIMMSEYQIDGYTRQNPIKRWVASPRGFADSHYKRYKIWTEFLNKKRAIYCGAVSAALYRISGQACPEIREYKLSVALLQQGLFPVIQVAGVLFA